MSVISSIIIIFIFSSSDLLRCVIYSTQYTRVVPKVMHPYLYLYTQKRYQYERKHKIQLRPCTLFLYLSSHPIFLAFNTTPPALNKSAEPVSAELFWLLLKLLGHSSFKFFAVSKMSAFEMFLESSKQI